MKSGLFVFAAMGLALVALSEPAHADPVQWGANGHYYEVVFSRTKLNWNEAHAAASSRSWLGLPGRLASINTAAEDAFVRGLPGFSSGFTSWLGSNFYQIGPYFGGKLNGTWHWVDGTGSFPATNAGPGYADWLGGEPNGQDATMYFAFGQDIGWADHFSNVGDSRAKSYAYVVEYQRLRVPEPMTAGLFALGVGAVVWRRRRRKM